MDTTLTSKNFGQKNISDINFRTLLQRFRTKFRTNLILGWNQNKTAIFIKNLLASHLLNKIYRI